ncbi:MAG: LptF/LptG family permease, partial [Alphaproteobacteria bacterium]|nr:LptF/LptG family permease [Alphaproteobacteria bacterium]
TIGIGILFITVLNPITVALNKHVQNLGFEYGLSSKKPFEFSEGGFWLKEKGAKDTMILFAKKIQQDQEKLHLYDVTVFLTSFDHMFKSQIQIEHATLADQILTFENLKIFSPGEKIKTVEKQTRSTNFSLNKIQETLSENDLISFWELPALINFLEKAGMNTRRQITLLSSLLFFPFLLSIFSLLGVAFSISKHVRHTRFFIRVALGIVSGFVFFFVDKVTLAMTHMGTLPIGLGIVGASLIVLFLTTSFLLHKEDA